MAPLWGKSMCEFGEEMEEPLLCQGSADPDIGRDHDRACEQSPAIRKSDCEARFCPPPLSNTSTQC